MLSLINYIFPKDAHGLAPVKKRIIYSDLTNEQMEALVKRFFFIENYKFTATSLKNKVTSIVQQVLMQTPLLLGIFQKLRNIEIFPSTFERELPLQIEYDKSLIISLQSDAEDRNFKEDPSKFGTFVLCSMLTIGAMAYIYNRYSRQKTEKAQENQKELERFSTSIATILAQQKLSKTSQTSSAPAKEQINKKEAKDLAEVTSKLSG